MPVTQSWYPTIYPPQNLRFDYFLSFFYCSINFAINAFKQNGASHPFKVGAELSVNLKLSWKHFFFLFFDLTAKTASAPQVVLFHFKMTFSGMPAQCCRWRSPIGCCFLGPPRGVVSHRWEAPARIFQTGAAWMHGGIWFPMWAPDDRSDLVKFYGLWSSGVFWK